MNFDGSALTKLEGTHDAYLIQPCGDFIVFTALRDNTVELMRMDADGTYLTELVRGNIFSPTCSREALYVYYVTYDDPQTIWRIGIHGGAPEKIGGFPADTITGALVLSPDGKSLAYPYGTYSTGTPGDQDRDHIEVAAAGIYQ